MNELIDYCEVCGTTLDDDHREGTRCLECGILKSLEEQVDPDALLSGQAGRDRVSKVRAYLRRVEAEANVQPRHRVRRVAQDPLGLDVRYAVLLRQYRAAVNSFMSARQEGDYQEMAYVARNVAYSYELFRKEYLRIKRKDLADNAQDAKFIWLRLSNVARDMHHIESGALSIGEPPVP